MLHQKLITQMETEIYEPGETLFFLYGPTIYKSELKSVITEKTKDGINIKYVFQSPYIREKREIHPSFVSKNIEGIFEIIPVKIDADYEDLPF